MNGGHWWQQVKLERRGDTPLAIAYSFPAFMYVFDLPYSWWRNPRCLNYMQKRPYGYDVERCYTMDFATLLFAD